MLGTGGRRLWLSMHIVSSVGWIGAVMAFIVLDVATVTSANVGVLRGAYISMDLITRWAIIPLALTSFVTGLVVALGTKWGLFRHYWVAVSLVLTAASTIVLYVQVPLIGRRAAMAADLATSDATIQDLGNLLLHSIGGTIVLLIIMVLNIYKPRGLTRYGWRKQVAQ
ncbi:MAG: DUF2269 domain-containing protein [Candidatus Thermoplasmatota archaeon]